MEEASLFYVASLKNQKKKKEQYEHERLTVSSHYCPAVNYFCLCLQRKLAHFISVGSLWYFFFPSIIIHTASCQSIDLPLRLLST